MLLACVFIMLLWALEYVPTTNKERNCQVRETVQWLVKNAFCFFRGPGFGSHVEKLTTACNYTYTDTHTHNTHSCMNAYMHISAHIHTQKHIHIRQLNIKRNPSLNHETACCGLLAEACVFYVYQISWLHLFLCVWFNLMFYS